MTPTADSLQGFRNRIINGAMVIDQRNAGATITAVNGDYTLDRWRAISGAASKFSIGRNAGAVTPPSGFSNYLGITSLSAYTVGASENFAFRQSVEGFNFADMAWGTAGAQAATLSFWVRSSLTGTFGLTLRNSSQNRTFPATYTISVANTWEQKTVSILGDTSGTWLVDNGIGVELQFNLGAGSSVSGGTVGAWNAASYQAPSGCVSVVGTNGATFYITGVQLEVGSVATPFERRDYGRELIMCQRYYEKVVCGGALYVAKVAGQMTYAHINYKASKRAVPTVALPAVSTASDSTGHTPSSMSSTEYASWYATLGGSLTNNVNSFTFTADAEL
jgi:hypothetical protein